MFPVLDSRQELIGKAEKSKNGFKVKLFNGGNIYYLQSTKGTSDFRVFKKLSGTLIKEISTGKRLYKRKSLIMFELENKEKVFIDLGPHKDIENILNFSKGEIF